MNTADDRIRRNASRDPSETQFRPNAPKATESDAGEIEELLAAWRRPTSTEELFGAAAPPAAKRRQIEARIREWIVRHAPPEDARD